MEFITGELTPWHWMTAGLLLFAVEVLAPTTFLLWPGIAAIVTGLITALIPILSWQLQVALFAVLTIASTFAGRYFYKRRRNAEAETSLNRRTDSYIGKEVTIEEAIVNGVGSITIGRTRWRVVGPDAAAGTKMTITGLDGSSLIVELVSEKS